jgi:integrase
VRTKGMRLRIAPIAWHAKYRYTIGGLRINGKRKRLFFETAREAQEALRSLQIKARREGQAGLDIPDALRAMASDCARRLAPYGKTIADATTFFLAHLSATESVCVEKLVGDYLRFQERNKLSGKHLTGIRARLLRFQEAFKERPVRTLNAAEIEEWLYHNGNGSAPQTLVHRRATLRALFGWALRQKLVDSNPLDAIAKPKVVRPAPAILTPENLSRFLAAAPFDLLPILAIGAFAGLRTAELLRLEWGEINLESGLVEVRADKAKSARRRLVRIEPNLAQWLAPYAGMVGKVWPGGERKFHEATTKLGRELGLKWQANGLRHSYASFHLAKFENAPALALSMGHTTPQMVFAHYREVVSPREAQRFWEIRP